MAKQKIHELAKEIGVSHKTYNFKENGKVEFNVEEILKVIQCLDLTFDEEAIEAIADKALERKTGARGLRAIMENVMLDLMYTIPSDDSISECVITKEMVEDNLKALESNPFK